MVRRRLNRPVPISLLQRKIIQLLNPIKSTYRDGTRTFSFYENLINSHYTGTVVDKGIGVSDVTAQKHW
jgi:hypothetical protein